MWEEAKKECLLALAAPVLATEAAKCVNSAQDEIDGLRSAQIKRQIDRLSAEITARARLVKSLAAKGAFDLARQELVDLHKFRTDNLAKAGALTDKDQKTL